MSADPSQDPLVARLRSFGTTIFAEMSALATRTGAVNLGQGFPDFDGPASMLDAAVEAIHAGVNQYPPGPGIPELRRAVAEHQHRFWGLRLDPDTEVLVTAGATEAVTAAVLALCEAGDEVVVLDPMYDSYAASIALAGAVARPVPLRPVAEPGGAAGAGAGGGAGGGGVGARGAARRGFELDVAALRAAVGPRTRLLLLNSPHNPTGAVLTREELAEIARLCTEHDVLAVTDEVYEHLTFDVPHLPLATLPGMRERTLTVSSAGKTFSCTGWKIGWVSGPAPLVRAVLRVKQYLTFVNGAPFQPAVAGALALPDDYYVGFAAELRTKRDRLSSGLAAAGFGVLPSEGTYFVAADISPLAGRFDVTDGVAFCRELPGRCGVVAVPMQVFYGGPEAANHLVRFTFGKSDALLDEAIARLVRLGG